MITFHEKRIDSKYPKGGMLEPTLNEVANEWNHNVNIRAYELETHIDSTYLDVIVPYILNTLHKLAPVEAKILDVGCGLGHLTKLISRDGYKVTGIDIAEKAIDYAKTTFPDINFHHTNIIDFSKRNAEVFDVCIVNMVLHNLIDIKNNLLALNKLLKKNGYVIASIPDPEHWFNKHPNVNEEFSFEYYSCQVYKIPFKIRRGSIHPSLITYIHRPIHQYNQLIKSAGLNIETSQHPILPNNKMDYDLLFCVWKKQ